MEFFDPYDAVLDELYDALITAQSVGVDITDIYMMLNGSCNVWGEYLCYGGMQETIGTYYENGRLTQGQTVSWAKYDETSCPNGKSVSTQYSKGGMECTVGAVIPPEDSPACTLNRTLTDMEEVQRNFLFADAGDLDEHVRIGCASSALESSNLFRNRKKQASIDIETLERIISQDAPAMFGSNKFGTSMDPRIDGPKYCAVNSTSYMDLQKAASLKKLPSRICVSDKSLATTFTTNGAVSAADYDAAVTHYSANETQANMFADPNYQNASDCSTHGGTPQYNTDNSYKQCDCSGTRHWVKGNCVLI